MEGKHDYQFKEGDRVWLFNPISPHALSSKLVSHWTGPYAGKRCVNEINYLIQLEGGCKIQAVHHNHLKLCTSPKSKLEQNEPHQVIASQKEDEHIPKH